MENLLQYQTAMNGLMAKHYICLQLQAAKEKQNWVFAVTIVLQINLWSVGYSAFAVLF